ncbi:MAG TPA: RNA polymerase sigma-70 factor [Bacteroidales bacterium]|nr:RNA polymerase sigma-70 factor [Bacteroidales bacterium]
MEQPDQKLIFGVLNGDLVAYEELYKRYYVYLCFVAEHITRSHADTEEIVSDVFVRLWNLREKSEKILSVKAYLIRAVHNASMNFIEQNEKRLKSTESLSSSDMKVLAWDSDYPLGRLYEKELQDILSNCINELPEACRKIFLLSRDKDMKYTEISNKLGISVNTVKSQVKIALSRLRYAVKNYYYLS